MLARRLRCSRAHTRTRAPCQALKQRIAVRRAALQAFSSPSFPTPPSSIPGSFCQRFSAPLPTLSAAFSGPSRFFQQCFSRPSATLAGDFSLPFCRLPRRFDALTSRATAPGVEAMYRRPPSGSMPSPSLFLRRCLVSSLYVPESLERPSSPPSVSELLKCPESPERRPKS